MSLSTIYSKTGKGAQVLTGKSKALPADSMRVLSHIDGKSNAGAVLAQLEEKFSEQELNAILARLLDGGHIRVVADDTLRDFFPDSGNATIDVVEISAEEFLKTEASAHGLDTEKKIRQQKEAEERAKAHAEEELRREAAVRAQEESERQLLEFANILGSSPETNEALAERKMQDEAVARAKAEAEKNAQSIAAEKAALAHQALTLEEEKSGAQENEIQLWPKTIDSSHQAAVEAKARREAEEKARIAAEREAAEKARQEAAAIAKREAEEKARIVAEQKAREEAERLARKQAEAAEKARREAEEKARIAAEREAAEKARQEAAAIAKREAEEKARIVAEQKAREEAERLARKQAEAEAKALAKQQAKREAESKALVKAEEKARLRAEREPVDIGKLFRSALGIGRKMLISVSVTALVLLLLLQLVNLSMLVSPLVGPVEKSLSENINEPVTIRKVYASLWPQPHLVLNDIAIGGSADIKIETIRVMPALLTIFDDVKTLRYIKVSGLNISQDNLGRTENWMKTSTKRGKLKFDQIFLEKTTVAIPGFELPPFDGELNFAADVLQNAILHTGDRNAIIHITPRNDGTALELTAENWQLPIGAPVIFEELNATGIVENNQLNISQIKGRLYGGNIKASMLVDWTTQWTATGSLKLSEVELEELMPALGSDASLDGPVTSSAAFTLQADTVAQLLENPDMNADFSVDGGTINGIDLGRAMRASDKNAIGGSTRFNTLTGRLTLQNGDYQLRQLALKAGQLHATGDINILSNKNMSGTVHINLVTKSRQMQSHINLSGTAGSPMLK